MKKGSPVYRCDENGRFYFTDFLVAYSSHVLVGGDVHARFLSERSYRKALQNVPMDSIVATKYHNVRDEPDCNMLGYVPPIMRRFPMVVIKFVLRLSDAIRDEKMMRFPRKALRLLCWMNAAYVYKRSYMTW